MKKLVCLLLCVIFILCGCGSAPAETVPPTTSIETDPPTTEAENTSEITLGNISFSIPDGFFVYSETAGSYGLMSDDRKCAIGLYATDFSGFDEAVVQRMLPVQHAAFLDENEVRYEESDINFTIAGFPVIMDFYCDISNMDNFQIKMNTSFTDSWNGYTVTFTCNSDVEDLQAYTTSFGELLAYSEYIGETPRFDYVQ